MTCEDTFASDLYLLQDSSLHHLVVLGKLTFALYVIDEASYDKHLAQDTSNSTLVV